MATIEVKLQDGQNLGFIQMRNNKPYYGYSWGEATDIPLEQAIKLCHKFSNIYKCLIYRNKNERKADEIGKKIIIV